MWVQLDGETGFGPFSLSVPARAPVSPLITPLRVTGRRVFLRGEQFGRIVWNCPKCGGEHIVGEGNDLSDSEFAFSDYLSYCSNEVVLREGYSVFCGECGLELLVVKLDDAEPAVIFDDDGMIKGDYIQQDIITFEYQA